VAIDPRKEAIFEAWFDYEHAVDEEAKIKAKAHRAELIHSLLEETHVAGDVTLFLRCFHSHYLEWQVGAGHRKARRRF
jgi:hypothetical protein